MIEKTILIPIRTSRANQMMAKYHLFRLLSLKIINLFISILMVMETLIQKNKLSIIVYSE